MSNKNFSRPDTSEYAAYYATYVSPIADEDVATLLTSQIDAFDSLRTTSESDAMHRYASGKWSVKEVIGHITDTERVFAYRMMRIARGDSTPLASFDQDLYVRTANADRLPIAKLIDSFRATRAATLSLMNEIDDDAWSLTGVASGFPVSARALVFIVAGHATHHIALLRDRYGMAV
jgi:uncharacterized damage-inducible protein DinB